MSRFHHSPKKYTRIFFASSRPGSIPSVFLVRRQRRSSKASVFQGELRKINPPTLNGEHRQGEEIEAWLLEMNKYFSFHNYPSMVETNCNLSSARKGSYVVGINLRNPSTLMRGRSHGGNSKDISRRHIFQSIIM